LLCGEGVRNGQCFVSVRGFFCNQDLSALALHTEITLPLIQTTIYPFAIVYRQGYIATMDKQNMTIKEVATSLGIADGRIRQLLIAGDPLKQRFGRDLMISVSHLARAKGNGKYGRPVKACTDGGISTVINAPDEGMPAGLIGQRMAQRTWKKATTKASQR
jgi:hypothetical protein